MPEMTPIVLVPGLGGSVRTFTPVLPAVWRFGSVLVADHTRDDSMAAIARRILSEAPPTFALIGHSMGGYIAFEIMRQAPERVTKLALLNTQARPDSPEAVARRQGQIDAVRAGRFSEGIAALYPIFVHASRRDDKALQAEMAGMAEDVGPEGYVRQLTAVMLRADSRPTLTAIRCPTLVLTSDQDNTLPNALSHEIAQGIAGAKLVTIAECGHMSPIERPAEVSAALTEWLAG